MISPWKSGCGNPIAINCTGPMAMAVPFLDRVEHRVVLPTTHRQRWRCDTPPMFTVDDSATRGHHTICMKRTTDRRACVRRIQGLASNNSQPSDRYWVSSPTNGSHPVKTRHDNRCTATTDPPTYSG